tara:strand:+ start:2775 stop:4904 length:2130 start_codon:yes stop_codon:yes gene_type:complete
MDFYAEDTPIATLSATGLKINITPDNVPYEITSLVVSDTIYPTDMAISIFNYLGIILISKTGASRRLTKADLFTFVPNEWVSYPVTQNYFVNDGEPMPALILIMYKIEELEDIDRSFYITWLKQYKRNRVIRSKLSAILRAYGDVEDKRRPNDMSANVLMTQYYPDLLSLKHSIIAHRIILKCISMDGTIKVGNAVLGSLTQLFLSGLVIKDPDKVKHIYTYSASRGLWVRAGHDKLANIISKNPDVIHDRVRLYISILQDTRLARVFDVFFNKIAGSDVQSMDALSIRDPFEIPPGTLIYENKVITTLPDKPCWIRDINMHDMVREEDMIPLDVIDDEDVDEVGLALYEEYMSKMFPDPEERLAIMMCLSSAMADEMFKYVVMLYGPKGDEGKSLFTSIVSLVFGETRVKTPDASVFVVAGKDRQANEHTDAIADLLRGDPLISMAHEVSDKHPLNEPLIRKVTGKDPISARACNATTAQYKPNLRLFFIGNNNVPIHSYTLASYNRMLVIRLRSCFKQNLAQDCPEDGLYRARNYSELEKRTIAEYMLREIIAARDVHVATSFFREQEIVIGFTGDEPEYGLANIMFAPLRESLGDYFKTSTALGKYTVQLTKKLYYSQRVRFIKVRYKDLLASSSFTSPISLKSKSDYRILVNSIGTMLDRVGVFNAVDNNLLYIDSKDSFFDIDDSSNNVMLGGGMLGIPTSLRI